ncbi:MAG: ABC transporter ATP-binding protein [Aggregatilineales bacterium]
MEWWRYIHYDEQNKPKVSWRLLKRVLGYARPYRVQLGLMLFMILVSSLVEAANPLLFRQLIDTALPNRDGGLLDRLALGIVAIPLVNAAIGVFQQYLSSAVGEGVIYDLRVALFAHLQRMSLRFFTNSKTGELMSRLNNDVVGAQTAINQNILGIITNLVTVVVTLTIMLSVEWRLTILGLLVLPLFLIPARRIGGRLRDIAREQLEVNALMNATMNETLNVSGALLVKLFGRNHNENERFSERAARVRKLGVRRSIVGSQFWAWLGLISAVGTAAVYWLGGHLAIDHAFTVGLIVMFAAYLGQLYGPLQSLTNAPVSFATSMVSFERVFEVLDLPVEVDEKPNAPSLKNVRGEVTFDHVSFSYAKTDEQAALSDVKRVGRMDNVVAVMSGGQSGDGKAAKPADKPKAAPNGHNAAGDGTAEPEHLSQARLMAIDDVSFVIKPGQLAALVGPSGAGKTTITYLLPRLYDPTSGRILIDGQDVRDVTLSSMAEAIGVVTQETYLFHDTIRTNLLYAKPDATDAEIEAAARAANIHDFISELPERYDTIVGERGYRLSGGEKQRLAIARVILKNPRILVLDEATSHLDSQSEALIQMALETVMRGRTSVVIAHRLSTILAADVILVLDRGRLVEYGTHAELLASGKLYSALYETQFAREQVGVEPSA